MLPRRNKSGDQGAGGGVGAEIGDLNDLDGRGLELRGGMDEDLRARIDRGAMEIPHLLELHPTSFLGALRHVCRASVSAAVQPTGAISMTKDVFPFKFRPVAIAVIHLPPGPGTGGSRSGRGPERRGRDRSRARGGPRVCARRASTR
jgi:hypothetical protein